MPVVRFIPDGVTISVENGTNLLETARRAGVSVPAPCNGEGTCGKCRMRVATGQQRNIDESSHVHLSAAERDAGWVLACRCVIIGNAEVESCRNRDDGLKIISEGRANDVAIHPWITKLFNPSTGRTDVLAGGELLASEEGDTTRTTLGIAVDIGTTTLVVSLVDLTCGRELAVASSLNPQTLHAQDVLSRIKMGSQPEGLRLLQEGLIAGLNELMAQAAAEATISTQDIYEAVFSGNTTMLHLAVGANPSSLGRYPYTPVLYGGCTVQAVDLGLAIRPDASVYLPPIMSAYVGADITSGILTTRLTDLPGLTLFVDIGTNGEMVLASDGKLTATSTAAGPAFEGMNISCGMRASRGAIERVAIADDFTIESKTIGGDDPIGLCGSGLLDAVGDLAARGIINVTGRFKTEGGGRDRFDAIDGKTVFRIAGPVYLSQKDIRQVQLAKAAVRAGIELMLAANGVAAGHIDRVLIAGSFGFHLRAASLINLGLLPREFQDRVEFVGNTSKAGAVEFLLDTRRRDQYQRIVRDVRVLELANDPAFEKTFVRAISF